MIGGIYDEIAIYLMSLFTTFGWVVLRGRFLAFLDLRVWAVCVEWKM